MRYILNTATRFYKVMPTVTMMCDEIIVRVVGHIGVGIASIRFLSVRENVEHGLLKIKILFNNESSHTSAKLSMYSFIQRFSTVYNYNRATDRCSANFWEALYFKFLSTCIWAEYIPRIIFLWESVKLVSDGVTFNVEVQILVSLFGQWTWCARLIQNLLYVRAQSCLLVKEITKNKKTFQVDIRGKRAILPNMSLL